MEETRLRDLGQLVEAAREKLRAEFCSEDISLSAGFRKAFAESIAQGGSQVEFRRAPAVITTSAGQKIYAPNQWFVLAAYAVDLVKEIIRYRGYTEKILEVSAARFRKADGTVPEKKEIYRKLKNDADGRAGELFAAAAAEYLAFVGQDSYTAENVQLLCRFVSDDKWWLGGKGIERTNDFYVSPVLGVLNLVNASQSYVATVTWLYISDDKLYRELPGMTERDDAGRDADGAAGRQDTDRHDSALYEKYYEEQPAAEKFISPVYRTGLQGPAAGKGFERNRIVFGAPGTGKSHRLKVDAARLLEGTRGTFERVTFHPDYTCSQFVGAYKPVSDESGEIRYEFVPGPFMRVYVSALRSGKSKDPQPHLLLIEEINRARVAAVFGDVFQLLDRDADGVSEYEIQATEDIRRYLADELGGKPDNYRSICLPDNLFLWATMNSADQGVFPMDTAFKRRWNFEYLGINENDSGIRCTVKLGTGEDEVSTDWNCLRRAINEKLAREYRVNEDKLLGPYFFAGRVIRTCGADGEAADPELFLMAFKSKVIMYLYEDAARQHRQRLFSGTGCDSSRYSSVCEAFDRMGMRIFGDDFKAEYYDAQKGPGSLSL